MNAQVIVPDNRGRVLLGKVTNEVAGHYLASVDGQGIITLIPAVVRPKMVDDILASDPALVDKLRDFVATGEKAEPSELWEAIRQVRE